MDDPSMPQLGTGVDPFSNGSTDATGLIGTVIPFGWPSMSTVSNSTK
jgi:hypothetical protein